MGCDTAVEEIISGTLEWCNERRAEAGKPALAELPKGKRHDSASCPCGVATGLLVGSSVWAEEERDLDALDHNDGLLIEVKTGYVPVGRHGHTPTVVRQFVSAFDGGQLPELVDHTPYSDDSGRIQ